MNRSKIFVAAAVIAAAGIVSGAPRAAIAAPGDHLWSKGWSVNGVGNAVDGAGATSVAGTHSGTVNFGGADLTAVGSNVFVAKFDADGVHDWSGTYLCTAFPTVTAVACSPDGNTYVAGTLPKGGTLDFGGGPVGGGFGDCWAVRFDANGAHVWSDSYGRGVIADIDATNSLVAFAARNVVSVDFGGGAIGVSGDSQAILAVLNADGTHVWSAGYGDTAFQEGREVGFNSTGGVVLLSAVQGAADFGGGGLAADANADLALAQFAAGGGAHEWSRIFHGGFSAFSSIVRTGMDVNALGGIAITGEFLGTADLGGGSMTSTLLDVFVARYDATGTYVWGDSYGTSADESGQSVWFDPSGNLVMCGRYNSGSLDFGGGALAHAGGTDLFVASLSDLGAHLWSRGFGTAGGETRCEAEIGPNGRVVLSASGPVNVDFGGGPIANGAFYVASLSGDEPPPVSTPSIAAHAAELQLTVGPNPFVANATIRWSAPIDAPGAELFIVDATGRRVRSLGAGTAGASGAGSSRAVVWDGRSETGAAVAPGVYFVKLATSAGGRTERIVRLK